MRGTVETWVNSQWKYRAVPGQLSVEINNHTIIDAMAHLLSSESRSVPTG
jgi:hypothetical protein